MTLPLLHANTRIRLATTRSIAMRHGIGQALSLCDGHATLSSNTAEDLLGYSLLKAELLYLDQQSSEALDTFNAEVRPKLDTIAPEVAVLWADNATLISFDVSLGTEDFYHLVDQRRLLGVELWNSRASVSINDAIRDGKHYEALTTCWQQLLRAYDGMCWRQYYLAELDIARECLALGWIGEAAYHGMLSLDKKIASQIGLQLASQSSGEVVRQTLDKIIPNAHLIRHAEFVSKLVHTISDIIPDDSLDQVIKWIKKHAPETPRSRLDSSMYESTWKAVARLVPRSAPPVALEFVNIATSHPWFTTPTLGREYLVDAICACVPFLEPPEYLRVTEQIIPLAKSQKQDHDFTNVINLLCQLAESGGDDVRACIKSHLYPDNESISNAILLRVASHFGVTIRGNDQLEQSAITVADRIRQQVQFVTSGEEPAKLGGYGTVTKPVKDGQLVAHVHGAQHNLDALVEHRHELSEQARGALANATLDMIENSDNLIANRVALVQSLARLLDSMPNESACRACAVLSRLAKGEITESQISMTYAEATNPLNRFKMNFGNPINLRGLSLVLLMQIKKLFPDIDTQADKTLLLQAMTDANSDIRSFGFAAAREAGQLSDDEQYAALLGIVETDEQVSISALSVFRDIDHSHLSESTCLMLARSLEQASRSPKTGIRRMVASIVSRALMANLTDVARAPLENIQAALQHDASFLVRQAIKEVSST